MSRIGEALITIPEEVQFVVGGHSCTIKGKEGELKINLPAELQIEVKDKTILVKRQGDDKKIKALHGLYRNLIANAITGVQKPWEKKLEIVGTGFNVQLQGEDLVFKLGFSHPVTFKHLAGIKFQVQEGRKITISGADKQLVGQVAQRIKVIKKPDVYKGKGIRYEGEQLKLRPGKKTGIVEGGPA